MQIVFYYYFVFQIIMFKLSEKKSGYIIAYPKTYIVRIEIVINLHFNVLLTSVRDTRSKGIQNKTKQNIAPDKLQNLLSDQF